MRETVAVGDLPLKFRAAFDKSLYTTEQKGATHNVHTMSHTYQKRQGPAFTSSTEIFESAYGQYQRCYRAGTPHITAQLLKNYYACDQYSRHSCPKKNESETYVRAVGKERRKHEDNTIISVGAEDFHVHFFRVYEIDDKHNTFRAKKLRTSCYSAPAGLGLDNIPWFAMGVYNYDGEEDGWHQLPQTTMRGKGVIIKSYIFEFKTEWMASKKSL